MKLDDYTLAAYLSGELPSRQRSTVAAALIQDAEARETLHMACEALAAALQHQPVQRHLEDRASRAPARPRRSAGDRVAFRSRRGQA